MKRVLINMVKRGLATPATSSALAAISVFSYKEDENEAEKLEKIRQSAKRTKLATSKYFKDTFLIKHSCALSFEAAAGLATQTYIALEECGQAYTEVTGELIQLYVDTVSPNSYLPIDWQERMVELQRDLSELKSQMSELEMLFQFVKKLLELNAEVAFLGGAEFVSTQASERLFSITNAGSSLIDKIHSLDLELAAAKAVHIEKSNKKEEPNTSSITEEEETEDTSVTLDLNESTTTTYKF